MSFGEASACAGGLAVPAGVDCWAAAAVDSLADSGVIVLHDEVTAGQVVFKKSISTNVNFAVVLPPVGIANLGIESGDFGHGPLFGFVAHPWPAENVVPHSG